MPKNRYLTWDAPTEMKLFHIILSVHRIKIDYVAVAKEFGKSHLVLRLPQPHLPIMCNPQHVRSFKLFMTWKIYDMRQLHQPVD